MKDITYCIASCRNFSCVRNKDRIKASSVYISFADFTDTCIKYDPKEDREKKEGPKTGKEIEF